eukprot:TRINITY_DN112_c0_g1_i2.p1 TRINITY_DN112_c0_g1~~TRINITY_DN112_c0_g1_i2.p1  ORF type:complete len:348 (+),score=33.25 TRINITY_DN112_c0_g1_i2:227-1270(+)
MQNRSNDKSLSVIEINDTKDIKIGDEDSKEGYFDEKFWNYSKSAIWIVLWYVPNIATLVTNKYVYDSLHFKFPLTLTAIHMLICFLGSLICAHGFALFKVVPLKFKEDIIPKIVPLAAVFCINIVLGNISLRWVPVSFMQTVKSLVPAFAVMLQVLFFRENVSLPSATYASLIPIVGGVALASTTEVNFDMVGFGSALLAAFVTALQTMLTGKLLKTELNPMNLMFYLTPVSFMLLIPFCNMYEYEGIKEWQKTSDNWPVVVLFLSGFIAFLLNVSSFLVIKNTSPLTYTVAGNCKVIFSVIVSVIIFKNAITIWNGIGCTITLCGVVWYNSIRYRLSRLGEKKTNI